MQTHKKSGEKNSNKKVKVKKYPSPPLNMAITFLKREKSANPQEVERNKQQQESESTKIPPAVPKYGNYFPKTE